jgi:translation initiation factor IF-1
VLPNTLYRVGLANGHKVLAHLAKKRRGEASYAPGDKVILVMSFFDLSQGRIKLETK